MEPFFFRHECSSSLPPPRGYNRPQDQRRASLGAKLLAAAVALAGSAIAEAADGCPWVGSNASASARADQVVAEMTLDEKLAMVHGGAGTDLTGLFSYVGVIPAIPRLCIPQLTMSDGPAGVRINNTTQLPTPVALASTWDPDAAELYGRVIGTEAAAKGVNVMLGPEIDTVRDPRAGRIFETYSEEPVLAGAMGVGTVKGIQSQRVQSQIKHWTVYNQETFRGTPIDDAQVSERVIRELYMSQFERVIKEASPSSVMCSYSYINGQAACENEFLNSVLKGEWGFRGYVTSDWVLATHSTVASALNGMDVEMPFGVFFGPPLKLAIKTGQVPESVLNDKVHRILEQEFRFGQFDRPQSGSYGAQVSLQEHLLVARDIATQGSVLLKNDNGVLPLAPSTRSIAVIGDEGVSAGVGSAAVSGTGTVSPLSGIQMRAGDQITVSYSNGKNPRAAAELAKESDVVILLVSQGSAEALDRINIGLLPWQTNLIHTVAQANPKTVVVLNTGFPVTMPWLGEVSGVLEMWYPGQESGNALAALLFGDSNPSGKLPLTFPKELSDVPAAKPVQFPGIGRVEYSEGLFVGYRWYDDQGIEPLFPFGFGLSYTTFDISDLQISAQQLAPGETIKTSVMVKNTGQREGSEVVQLYLSYPAPVGEPPKLLKAFSKVTLKPGESRRVGLNLSSSDAAFWHTDKARWDLAPGEYRIQVGNSSVNLPLSATFGVAKGGAVPR